jgi:hypothetical protein
MALSDEQYQARIAYLKSQVAAVQLPRKVYDQVRWLVRGMLRHYDDIDPVIFDLEGARIEEIEAALSNPAYKGEDREVRLSLLDLFDLQNIGLLAERDLLPFAGAEPCNWTKEDMAALTAALDGIQKRDFPQESKGIR